MNCLAYKGIFGAGVLSMLLLLPAGCTSTGQQPTDADAGNAASESAGAAAEPIDEDVMYRVLAGEYLVTEDRSKAPDRKMKVTVTRSAEILFRPE